MPEFLNAYLNSPLGQAEVQERSRTTSGLRSLSVGRIKQIEIPLPPILEQQRIVAYQGEVSEQSSRLTQLQSQTAAELDALLPSILDRAFSGKLEQ
jgi:type I restriction enzyme S subunit